MMSYRGKYFTICFVLYITYVLTYNHFSQVSEKQAMRNHADVISSQMWDYNVNSMRSYIELTCKSNDYNSFDIVGEKGFISEQYKNETLSTFENILQSIKLIPEKVIETDVEFNSEKIGRIIIHWNPKWFYVHIVVLFLLILLTLIIYLLRKTLHAKEYLESEVEKRTYELKEAQQHIEIVINSMPTLLVVVNIKNEIVLINDKVKDIIGLESDDIVTRKFDEILTDFDLKHDVEECLQEYKTISKPNLRTGDGKVYNITLFPLSEEKQEVGISIDDVTVMSKMQEKVNQAQKMDSMGVLVSGLAHDFNNILSGITGSISLLDLYLKNEQLSKQEKVHSSIETISKASSRATDMVQQLLSFSRKHVIETKAVEVSDIISNVVKLCYNSFPKSVDIDTSNSVDAVVKADQSQLSQVLLNLCINGMHAMTIMRKKKGLEGGKLKISTSRIENPFLHGKNHEVSFVKVSIKDTGVGINEEHISKIFDPFFSTKEDNGTGLGLAMAYNTISQFGGYIDCDSIEGVGTEFIVYLPECEKCLEISSSHKIDESKAFSGKILIVDDEDLLRNVATDMLKLLGLDVISASNGFEAEKIFMRNNDTIDFILLDYAMPKMSGLEFYERVKGSNVKSKVIVSSGNIDESAKDSFRKLGVDCFMNKPYDIKVLSSFIQ